MLIPMVFPSASVYVPPPPPPPPVPADVTGIRITGTLVDWDYPNPPADLAGFDVRAAMSPGDDWESAAVVAGPSNGLFLLTEVALTALPPEAAECLVKAENAIGLVSVLEARITIPGVGPPPPPPPGGADEDDASWPEPPALASVAASDKHTFASLTGTINGSAGDHYILTGNQSGGACTINGTGTKDAPIVVRGNSDSADPNDWPEWTAGTLNLRGTRIVVMRIRFRGRAAEGPPAIDISGGARWIDIRRNVFYRFYGGQLHGIILIYGDVQRVRINRNWPKKNGADVYMACFVKIALSSTPAQCPQYIDFLRNLIEECELDPNYTPGDDPEPVYMGDGPAIARTDPKLRVFRNLFLDNNQAEQVEIKGSGCQVFENTIQHTKALSHRPMLKMRIGSHNSFNRNLFVMARASGGVADISVRGGDHTIIDNACVWADDGTTANGTVSLLDGSIDWDNYPAGVRKPPDPPPKRTRPSSKRCEVGGNRLKILVGAIQTGEPEDNKAAAHHVAPKDAGRSDKNHDVSINNDRSTGTIAGGAVAGAQYGRTLTRLGRSDVGINHPQRGTNPPPPPPPGNPAYTFLPTASTNWAVDSGVGTFAQLASPADGVRLTGQPYAGSPPAVQNVEGGIRMYNRGILTDVRGKFRWNFTRKVKPLNSQVASTGAFNLVGLVIGDTDADSHNPADWDVSRSSTQDEQVAEKLKGWRCTYGNIGATAANSNQFRCQIYTGTGKSIVNPFETAIDADLLLNVQYLMELEWDTGFVALRTINADGSVGMEQTFRDPGLTVNGDRVLMMYTGYGADSLIENVTRTA